MVGHRLTLAGQPVCLRLPLSCDGRNKFVAFLNTAFSMLKIRLYEVESMKRISLLFCGVLILGCFPVWAQTDINHYTLFTGFDYMVSPARNLTERGVETDFGVTMKP